MIYLASDAGSIAGSYVGPVLAAIGVVVTAALTAITTLRTSQRASALQQQQALEARSDKQYERAIAQRDEAETELEKARANYDAMRKQRDEALEELARLKQRVWVAGHDPETIGREPGTNEPRPRI